MDEWVTQKRLNLEKVKLPKVEDKKKSSAASSAASKSKSKQNPSKSKQNNSSNSQPVSSSSSQPPSSSSQQSESQPVLSEVEAGSSTPTAINKNKSGNLFGRKRKANDEVYSYFWNNFYIFYKYTQNNDSSSLLPEAATSQWYNQCSALKI